MRKIDYIFIDSDTQDNNSKSGRSDVSNLRYHFIVNVQGLVINTTDIKLTTKLIAGPIYDPDKFNRCSIFIRYCGSLRPKAWLIEPEIGLETRNLKSASKREQNDACIRYAEREQTGPKVKLETRCRAVLKQRSALIRLLVDLRQHYPDAKILGLSEIDGKALHSRNIIVSDAMNVLRRELSEYP